ncbi:MAG: peptidylprolyl isomerase [Firmicutes bacterium]|nr:peptidylprolyl isomerase [Bacillota bacterium]
MDFKKYGKVLAIAGVFILIMAVSFTVAGCSKEPVAASINGKVITVAEVDKQLDQVLKASGQHGDLFNGEQGQQLREQFRMQILDRLIDLQIMLQEAEKRGITATAKDVDAKLESIKQQLNIKSEKQLDDALKQNGLTKEQMREELRKGIIVDRLGEQVTRSVKVTDKEAEQYYNTHKSEFATKDQIHAAHILVQKEEDAKNILQQVQNGADFAALAKQYNSDSTKDTGGDLSWIEKDKLDATFADAAWNLQPGQICSAPVKTQFGYHIIKLIDKKAAVQKTFEEAKAEAKDRLLKQKKAEAWQKWFDGIKKKTDIRKYLTPPKTEAPVVPNTGGTQGGSQGGNASSQQQQGR